MAEQDEAMCTGQNSWEVAFSTTVSAATKVTSPHLQMASRGLPKQKKERHGYENQLPWVTSQNQGTLQGEEETSQGADGVCSSDNQGRVVLPPTGWGSPDGSSFRISNIRPQYLLEIPKLRRLWNPPI